MTSLRVIDWFSGIGGFHLAFSRAGHRIVGACEINPFARRVYAKRFGAPAWFPSDINEVDPHDIPEADLWIAGSPCQGFSHAGLGLGLDDPRSGLLRRLLHLLAIRRPRFFLLENVPGILTANGGQDFGELLATLDWLGYVGAWATLDARYFGVAQRRRRVFLVAGAGDGFDPRPFLFEPEGVPGYSPARRETQTDIAGTLGGGSGVRGWCDDLDRSGAFIIEPVRQAYGRNNTSGPIDTSGALTSSKSHRFDFETDTFVLESMSSVVGLLMTHTTPRGHGCAGVNNQQVAAGHVIPDGGRVRRLTPLECERLQGFPDGWTCLCGAEPYSTAACTCPDGPRYRALGNAVAVPCIEWLAHRFALHA